MKIKKLETKVNHKYNYGLFQINSLEPSFGLTLANSLTRVLQNDIFGVAITSFTFESKNNIIIEEFIREDILDLMFNFQNVILKSNYLINTKYNLVANENKVYTAKNILLDENIKIINPNQYLFTKNNNLDLNIVLNVETGKGIKTNSSSQNDSFFFIDVNFSPVIKTNFKIKLESNKETDFNLKETLLFEIWTNKSLTPYRSLLEGIKILSKRFISLIELEKYKAEDI